VKDKHGSRKSKRDRQPWKELKYRKADVRHATKLSNFVAQLCCVSDIGLIPTTTLPRMAHNMT